MSILVLGGSGLVGSAIIRELEKQSKTVIGVSSKELNLLDRDRTFTYIKEINPVAIIDAAGKVGGIVGNDSHPVDFLTQNVQMQSNAMDAAHAAGIKKFVFLGSGCVYPRNCPQPIKEDYLLTGELEQTNSAYAVAKIAGIELIKAYRKQYGHSWISLMPANLYGPHDNFDLEMGHVFPAFIRKFSEAVKNNSAEVLLWGSGSPLREFLHVDDLAKAVLLCMEKYDEAQQINIGSGIEVTIKDLAQMVATKAGFKGNIVWDANRPDGTPRKILDNSKLEKLGWKPSITLDEGISSTLNWYQNNKVRT
jgi:GDP-L-fucose synthase